MNLLHAGALLGAAVFALSSPAAAVANPTPSLAADTTKAVLARIAAERRAQAAPVSHFKEPYGLATDLYGNLFVANVEGNDAVEVYASLTVRGKISGTGTPAAISVAVDNQDDVYVGSEYGYINKFTSTGSLTQTITANASFPSSIAVDEYQNVYVVSGSGLALDGPDGKSIYSSLLSGSSVESLALGGPYVYAYADDQRYIGGGTAVLRNGFFVYSSGAPSSAPVGSACANNGTCWVVDSSDDHLTTVPLVGQGKTLKLGYLPAGVAYDTLRDRLFVADPVHNAVQVYTASTLKFAQTIR